MTVPLKPALCLAAVALLTLSGCGGGPATTSPGPDTAAATTSDTGPSASPAPQGASAEACSILSRQELSQVVGADPGPGTDNSDSTTSACAYTAAGAVSVVIDSQGGRQLYDGFCPTDQPRIQQVPGVGDSACLTIVGGAIAAMYVLKGSDVLSINIQAGPAAQLTPGGLAALGKLAADRL